MKITTHGLKKIQKAFNIDPADIADNYLLKTAERLRKLSISKTANVTGEMIRETTAFKSKVGVTTVAVNVAYGAYNHEGRRADGSRVIRNRTAPGQKHFLRKSALELDLQPNVAVILEDLKKKML